MTLTFAVDKSAVLLCRACSREPDGVVVCDAEGRHGVWILDSIRRQRHFLPIVDACKHLGTIAVSNATPGPEIAYRLAKAMATLVPLRRKPFSEASIPLPTRRTLLRALVVSKYVFSCCNVQLHAAVRRRSWCRGYVRLWRALCRWREVEQAPHSLAVLRTAAAPSPLLALALARAKYLVRLLRHGPPALLHLLRVHWVMSPACSWLGQFATDFAAVATFVPEAILLRQGGDVKALLDSLSQDPTCWPRRVRDAVQAYIKDLEVWHEQYQARGACVDVTIPSAAEWRVPSLCLF